jgi:hypothetical protein
VRVTPPSGIAVPRPFDIRAAWRQPQGRSSGGALVLANYEGMDWTYAISGDRNYTTFFDLYVPTNPWVWVFYPDIYSGVGTWFEAVLSEMHVERGMGSTLATLIVPFRRMVRYEG